MTPGMIQRHQDYVLGPNQDARLASVAAGQLITGITLGLDGDAPFLLRSRAMRVKYDAQRRQTGLNHLLMRYAGPNRNYFSQHVVRQGLVAPYFGQIGNPIPVFPQVIYPRSGIITVDVQNDGATALTNLTLYFRGVKLFSPGAVKSYEYPAKFGLMPFMYPVGLFKDSDNSTLVRSLGVTQAGLRQTFRCKGDADFPLRGGQIGVVSDVLGVQRIDEVFARLRDEDEKPYSNDVVHVDVLFGSPILGGSPSGPFPCGSSPGIAAVGGGPNSPGLFFPEIYVPKNHLLFLDVSRSDGSIGGAVTVDYPISFIGMKVFQK